MERRKERIKESKSKGRKKEGWMEGRKGKEARGKIAERRKEAMKEGREKERKERKKKR